MQNIVLFGPPGSGKGTQAQKLEKKYGILQISTGDLFRCNIKLGTKLGKEAQTYMNRGELVPDSVTINMLKDKIENEAETAKGFIFDGFPRTVAQAEALDKLMQEKGWAIGGMIGLEVGEDELVKRLLLRGKESGRKDDQDEATIRNRFNEYQQKTMPVADFYKGQNKFYSVKGEGGIDDIFNALCEVIDKL